MCNGLSDIICVLMTFRHCDDIWHLIVFWFCAFTSHLDFLEYVLNRVLFTVRHEVNGKHRVLAAYNIFTLEEAYRYNDRQWLGHILCVRLLITSGVLSHLTRLHSLLEYVLLSGGNIIPHCFSFSFSFFKG